MPGAAVRSSGANTRLALHAALCHRVGISGAAAMGRHWASSWGGSVEDYRVCALKDASLVGETEA